MCGICLHFAIKGKFASAANLSLWGQRLYFPGCVCQIANVAVNVETRDFLCENANGMVALTYERDANVKRLRNVRKLACHGAG